jgi:RNA-directed DNA polymerase
LVLCPTSLHHVHTTTALLKVQSEDHFRAEEVLPEQVFTHALLGWLSKSAQFMQVLSDLLEAEALKAELQARLTECHLEMHPTKTKVVYCKDGKRKGKYPNVKFDFLGYCFRPRLVRRFRDNSLFGGFNPAVSPAATKAMRATIRDLNLRRQTQLSLQDIARQINPLLRGWIA